MHVSIVMTVLATDRPGLVSTLSETIASRGGSWQESRMARLAGRMNKSRYANASSPTAGLIE